MERVSRSLPRRHHPLPLSLFPLRRKRERSRETTLMPAPNIEMIEASLRSCSLRGRERAATVPPPPPPQEQTDESEGVTAVELNSEVALPYHWEQHLDMRTGEIYYINWTDGTRTTEDPRTATADPSTPEASNHHSSDADAESSSESSSRRRRSSALVAAGCRACYMYFMVPKREERCPKCGGGGLIHVGRRRRSRR